MAIGRSQIEQLLKGASAISSKANKNTYNPLKAIAAVQKGAPKGEQMVMSGNVAKKINYGKKIKFNEQANRNGKRSV
tara:strand:+ start:37 stop:267 length:231 start_codon:yes stop_codon:yes gene_type:complete